MGTEHRKLTKRVDLSPDILRKMSYTQTISKVSYEMFKKRELPDALRSHLLEPLPREPADWRSLIPPRIGKLWSYLSLDAKLVVWAIYSVGPPTAPQGLETGAK